MAEMTGDKVYKDSLEKFCDQAANGQEKSPGGMLYYAEWGSLRYASNAAFICLQVTKKNLDNIFVPGNYSKVLFSINVFEQAADLIDGKENAYTNLAQGQMNYILGDNPNGQR